MRLHRECMGVIPSPKTRHLLSFFWFKLHFLRSMFCCTKTSSFSRLLAFRWSSPGNNRRTGHANPWLHRMLLVHGDGWRRCIFGPRGPIAGDWYRWPSGKTHEEKWCSMMARNSASSWVNKNPVALHFHCEMLISMMWMKWVWAGDAVVI